MTNQEDYQIEIDELAVGLTRPPMFFGVMMQVALVNIMLGTIGYIYLKTFYIIPFCALLHFIAMRLSIKEPRFLMQYYLYFAKTPPVLNIVFWGNCNSYFPE